MAVLPPLPRLIVTWPAKPDALWGVRLVDADTGRDWTPVALTVTVTVSPGKQIVADVLMITDENDQPQANNGPSLLDDSGTGYRKGMFRFGVAEMRVEDSV